MPDGLGALVGVLMLAPLATLAVVVWWGVKVLAALERIARALEWRAARPEPGGLDVRLR